MGMGSLRNLSLGNASRWCDGQPRRCSCGRSCRHCLSLGKGSLWHAGRLRSCCHLCNILRLGMRSFWWAGQHSNSLVTGNL